MFGFFIRKLFDISCISDHVQPISKPLIVVTCAEIFPHSPVLLCGHIGLNKMKQRNRLGISTLNSLLTVQFNVPKKCNEFKPNTELLKTCKCCEQVFYFPRNCCLDFLWIFCCPKIWITQASNLEITIKITATL